MSHTLGQTSRGRGLGPGTDRAFSLLSLDTGGWSRPTRLQWTSWPFRARYPSAARPVMPCRVTTTTSHLPSPLTVFKEVLHWRAGGAPHGAGSVGEKSNPRAHCDPPHPSAPLLSLLLGVSPHHCVHCTEAFTVAPGWGPVAPPSSTLTLFPVSKPLLLWVFGGAFYAGLWADKASSAIQLLDLRSRIQLWVVPSLGG